MTIKDSQQSRCVELIAELGEASGEDRRKLLAELDKTCGEATSQPFARLRGASVGPMAFHSSFDDDQHSCSYVY